MNFYRKLLVDLTCHRLVCCQKATVDFKNQHFILFVIRIGPIYSTFWQYWPSNLLKNEDIFSSRQSINLSFASYFHHRYHILCVCRELEKNYNTRVSPLTVLCVCFSYFHTSELLMSDWFHILISDLCWESQLQCYIIHV